MAWIFDSTRAVFLQIAEKIKEDILNGKYPPDSQIPSVRQIAFEASVNPNTVQKALLSLEAEGLIVTKGTMGKFVSRDQSQLEEARKERISNLISSFLKEAETLGLDRDAVISYIKEEK